MSSRHRATFSTESTTVRVRVFSLHSNDSHWRVGSFKHPFLLLQESTTLRNHEDRYLNLYKYGLIMGAGLVM